MASDTPLVRGACIAYRNGSLHCEDVPLVEVAVAAGTPAYVYSARSLDDAYASIDKALAFAPHLIAYAVKANGNLALLSRLARAGSGADIVSGGELARALRAGIPPAKIVFSGVGKRDEEIESALAHDIRSLHVESAQELDVIETIASRRNTQARIALRVNPDVDPVTHPYIATGLHNSKFGLEIDGARALLPRILRSRHLKLEGIACHIGSQLLSAAPVSDAVTITARFARECIDAGAPVRVLDVGGGWPVVYGNEQNAVPTHAELGEAIREGLERASAMSLGLELLVEPGRTIVANAGVLLATVLFVKERANKRFVIIDAGMTELLRPALYGAHHEIVPLREPSPNVPRSTADVVGPVCETGDFLALARPLPPLARGDKLAILGAGAYSAVMASTYNARPRAPEVLVEGGRTHTVREREPQEQLWANETIP